MDQSQQAISTLESVLTQFSLSTLDFWMILVGAPLFYLFLLGLRRSLFVPFMALLEVREAVTTGAQDTASAVLSEADKIGASVEQKLSEVRVAAMRKKLERVAEARAIGEKELAQAEQKAQSQLQVARDAREKELQAIRQASAKSVDTFAEELTSKILSPSSDVVRTVKLEGAAR